MDRGQRKRLADICEKLGVAFFAGVALKGIRSDMEILLILAFMALFFVLGMWWYLSRQQR